MFQGLLENEEPAGGDIFYVEQAVIFHQMYYNRLIAELSSSEQDWLEQQYMSKYLALHLAVKEVGTPDHMLFPILKWKTLF